MSLEKYNRKRRFAETPEPEGKKQKGSSKLHFVVQKHHASRLHYDFRLELDGVLKSWAVPKGPSLNPADKRLAMMVEDHPMSYMRFEGTIPEGNYGAGKVIVWDIGTYHAEEAQNPAESEKQLRKELKEGRLKLVLKGKKLKGSWALVRMQGSEENAWLLIKHDDEHASTEDVTKKINSAISSRKLADDDKLERKSSRKAAEKKTSPETKPKAVAAKQSAAASKAAPARKTASGKTATAKSVSSNKAAKPKSRATESKQGAKEKAEGKARKSSGKAKSAKSGEADRERAEPPYPIKPMLATLVDKPFDDDAWIFEQKWDGYRAIGQKQGKAVRLYSRNANSFAEDCPEIVKALGELSHDCVIDGEVVALDSKGRERFQLLQNHGNAPKGKLSYRVFDLLFLHGHDLRKLPLLERKKLLKGLLRGSKLLIFSEHIEGKGTAFFAKAEKAEREGIIAKKADSPYRDGERSGEWLKIKTSQRQEAVIAGFTAPRGSRSHIGSLILGVYEEGMLQYIGHTGAGLDEALLASLSKRLKRLQRKTSPFAKVPKTNAEPTWLRPELVCEVRFSEWTADGHMRQPVFVDLRVDKPAREVKREMPRSTAKQKSSAEKKVTAQSELKLTNLDKLYWPDEKISKGELIAYYEGIADVMLPYLKDRPQSLNRHPDGIKGHSFYQKDVDYKVPSFMETKDIFSDSRNEKLTWLLAQNRESLLYIVNLGCIEINVWNSRVQKLDNPDYMVIDLDPDDNDFDEVIALARLTHRLFDEIGVENYCKTSGKSGMHIYVPLAARYTSAQAREFGRIVATRLHELSPENTSIERSPAKRRGLIYLDYLQNRTGATLAAPYSARPWPGATVSTPLKWSEVRKGLSPAKFTIFNTLKRLEKVGDLFEPVLGKGIDMQDALKRLQAQLAGQKVGSG